MIASKLCVPKLRLGLVPRPRLVELLHRGTTSKLILLSAPAGFGKTTLLAEWLDRTFDKSHAVAWLSLDPGDNEPAAFWPAMVAALQTSVPTVGQAALELSASRPFQTELVLTTLLNELMEIPHDVVLVLDDYHLVDSREVGDGMALLLGHLPSKLHLVISTRADPALPLARWRVRGELVEIRAAQLRFTPVETAAYFNGTTGLDLTENEVAAVEQRTEGWAAALQLAALSLQGRDDAAEFIARFTGNDRYVLDYLVQEVLQQQAGPVREFLLLTSILDRLTGPLCDAVTGRDDGSHSLIALEHANLFTVPLDDGREWYRYHRLFADMLRARLLSEQPGQIPQLHQHASRWYEDRGMLPEAVGHAMAAGDFERTAHLMELAAPWIRRERLDSMMLGWLKELPDSAIRNSPVLSTFYGFMLMTDGDLNSVEPRLKDAERAMAAIPEGEASPWADIEEFHTLPATIAIYRAALAQARGDVAGTLSHARHARQLSGPADHLARGAAAGFLGMAAWAEGDIPGALQEFTQAVASLHSAGNTVDELSSTVVLADMWLAAGRPGKARQLMQAALQRSQAHGTAVARASAELHVALGEIDCETGDFNNARSHLDAAALLLKGVPANESRFRWFAAKGLLAHCEGELEQAIECFEQSEPLYQRGFFPEVRPIAAMKARVLIAQGKLLEAGDWAREQGDPIMDGARYLDEFNQLTLVRLLLAQDSETQQRPHPGTGTGTGTWTAGTATATGAHAASLLERLAEAAKGSGRAGSLMEIRMLQALVHAAQGRKAQALETLGMAFTGAPEPGEYRQLFRNEGTPMTELLHHATQHGVAVDHARRLLRPRPPAQLQGDGSSPRLGPASSGEMLSEREMQVLRLLASDLSGPQIARELFISYNTLRTHTKHIFTKLGVTDRRSAVRMSRDLGMS
ncbi:LuxR C-terminal-related transcriptional regulator [Arthrobacter sp. PAMC 25486]|uniref:LuxR C-terminal-related transcriptional regulator n=1 Tax=Arthrobacter sp. PAMC 25486 TaxID=1494608 RepID=UPI00138DD842|nr:LuxR C-terminal-related transcriptional regulator [Arthrobacter sp. PAMC 25486]